MHEIIFTNIYAPFHNRCCTYKSYDSNNKFLLHIPMLFMVSFYAEFTLQVEEERQKDAAEGNAIALILEDFIRRKVSLVKI